MGEESWTIIAVGAVLLGYIAISQRRLDDRLRVMGEDMHEQNRELREDLHTQSRDLRKEMSEQIGNLRERMAHLEGLLQGLREAITRERTA